MAEVIIMPKLGFNMDEGELVKCRPDGGAAARAGGFL